MILLLLTMIIGTYGTDKFAVTGGCTTNGACFQSLNYPNDYGPSESCSITVQSVLSGETLSSAAFNTESGYDKLVVKDVEYSGTSGPSNVAVAVNDVFTWGSDDAAEESGFQVCLVGACLKTDGIQANAGACRCGTSDCTSSNGLFCTFSINTCHQLSQLPIYKERTSGNCGDSDGEGTITSPTACEAGAAALGWGDTTAETFSWSYFPPGCFDRYGDHLRFNTYNSNVACTSSSKCLCTLTCQPGTYQDQLGQPTCKSCPPDNTYQDEAGKNECKPCNAGEYQDQVGKSECKSCGVGNYITKQSECKSCPPGTYQDQSGQSECIACGNDKYSLGGSKCVTKEKFKAAYSTQSAQSC